MTHQQQQITQAHEAQPIEGGCLCGTVKFNVADRFIYAGFCHCRDCQIQTGSAFTMTAAASANDLKVTAGDEAIRQFAKTPETVLHFCGACGSHLFALKTQRGAVHVRIGALDRPPSLAPMGHMFARSMSPWLAVADDLPKFPENPPGLSGSRVVDLGAESGFALLPAAEILASSTPIAAAPGGVVDVTERAWSGT